MCLGSSKKASKAAAAAEEKRRKEIEAANRRIDAIFSSPERQGDITDLENATRGYLQSDLDRKKGDADRQLKFAMARGGLSHGSADIDQNLRLGDDYLRGILEVERRAKTAGSTLRSQDAETKAGLFSQVLGGLDTTTAAQQAAQALSQNVDLAKSQAYQSGIGEMFGDFSDIFKNSKTAAGDRRATYDFNTLYGSRNKPPPQVAGGIYG
jgi:hypothetical protein